MITRIKISLKTIVVLIVITFILAFITCYIPDPPLKNGIWDQGKWDVDVWGE